MVLAGFEGLDEETVGSKEVMLASLGLLVHLDLGVEVLVECGDGCLQGWWGFWGLPLALDVELGVVGVVEVTFVGRPVGLSPDVLGESGDGAVQFGFGECRLEAEFEAVPEEFSCARGWWDGRA